LHHIESRPLRSIRVRDRVPRRWTENMDQALPRLVLDNDAEESQSDGQTSGQQTPRSRSPSAINVDVQMVGSPQANGFGNSSDLSSPAPRRASLEGTRPSERTSMESGHMHFSVPFPRPSAEPLRMALPPGPLHAPDEDPEWHHHPAGQRPRGPGSVGFTEPRLNASHANPANGSGPV
jgi:hypothetical protein